MKASVVAALSRHFILQRRFFWGGGGGKSSLFNASSEKRTGRVSRGARLGALCSHLRGKYVPTTRVHWPRTRIKSAAYPWPRAVVLLLFCSTPITTIVRSVFSKAVSWGRLHHTSSPTSRLVGLLVRSFVSRRGGFLCGCGGEAFCRSPTAAFHIYIYVQWLHTSANKSMEHYPSPFPQTMLGNDVALTSSAARVHSA